MPLQSLHKSGPIPLAVFRTVLFLIRGKIAINEPCAPVDDHIADPVHPEDFCFRVAVVNVV